MNIKEIWKSCLGWEEYYQASNLGNVRSLPRTFWNPRGFYSHTKGKILTQKELQSEMGYYTVNFMANNKRSKPYVHKLVVEAFSGKIPENMTVNHIDGDPHNNNIDNLEIVTLGENISKAAHKRNGVNQSKTKYKIKVIDCDTLEVSLFDTCRDAAKHIGVSDTAVRSQAIGKAQWKIKGKYIIENIYGT